MFWGKKNLLKNACVHNIDGGKVTVVCCGGWMEIRNSSGRGALDGGQIFERFYQGEKKEGSTGLGLAIVDSICRHSNLGIQYIYIVGESTALRCGKIKESCRS